MRVEVDQSGRIDETNKPTVLALANGTKFSIRLSGRAKRAILAELRRRRKKRPEQETLYILVFATLVYLLLKEHIGKLSAVVIDTEFTGHEGDIKAQVINLFLRHGREVHKDVFQFSQIGKKSPAHGLAISVFRGKVKPDQEITAKDVLAEFRHKK